jgi:GNAT superfamily N-acetyltransferase
VMQLKARSSAPVTLGCGTGEIRAAIGRRDAERATVSQRREIHPGKELRGGWVLVAARRILHRIPHTPLDLNCLYFLEYRGIPPDESATHGERSGPEVRGAIREDFENLDEEDENRHPFLTRIDSSERCVLALRQGRIVGYQWFCDHAVHMEERYSIRIDIPADSIYTYDAFISPEFRLTGIWVKFQSLYLRGLMQKLGKSRIITMVDRGNLLSLATHLRFGYRPFRRVLVAKVFSKSLSFTTNYEKDQAEIAGGAQPAVSPQPHQERAN